MVLVSSVATNWASGWLCWLLIMLCLKFWASGCPCSPSPVHNILLTVLQEQPGHWSCTACPAQPSHCVLPIRCVHRTLQKCVWRAYVLCASASADPFAFGSCMYLAMRAKQTTRLHVIPLKHCWRRNPHHCSAGQHTEPRWECDRLSKGFQLVTIATAWQVPMADPLVLIQGEVLSTVLLTRR
jgi:hypothetical protein